MSYLDNARRCQVFAWGLAMVPCYCCLVPSNHLDDVYGCSFDTPRGCMWLCMGLCSPGWCMWLYLHPAAGGDLGPLPSAAIID
eukprot:1160352-Pelagomonas_calceolata.AAC.1